MARVVPIHGRPVRAKPVIASASFPGTSVRCRVTGGTLVIERDDLWRGRLPVLRIPMSDVLRLRAVPAGRLADDRPAASLWIDTRGEPEGRELAKRGEAEAVTRFAQEVEALVGLRDPLPADNPLDDGKAQPVVGAGGEPGEVRVTVAKTWRAHGGVVAAGPWGVQFEPSDRLEKATRWRRSRILAVETRCSVGHSSTWELSVRGINGRREGLFEGQPEARLKALAAQLNAAMGVPPAAERVRAALAEHLQALAPMESTGGDGLTYSTEATVEPLYQRNAGGLRILLPIAPRRWAAPVAVTALLALVSSVSPRFWRDDACMAASVVLVASVAAATVLRPRVRVAIDVDDQGLRVTTEGRWRRRVRQWACDEVTDVSVRCLYGAGYGDVVLDLRGQPKVIATVAPATAANEVGRRLRVALGLPEVQSGVARGAGR